MLLIWDAIEADFMRDYGIDLTEQLYSLSWRKFVVLMQNLSPEGAVAVRIRSEQENAKPSEEDENSARDFFTAVLSNY